MLEKIKAEDLIFSGELEDDRTNTFVSLDDYDWMNYKINTSFKTERLGKLDVEFEYFGMTSSTMKVIQTLNNNETKYEFEYSTDLFQKYIIKFLTKHIMAWDSEYAFNGEDIVIEFYNEVLDSGTSRG